MQISLVFSVELWYYKHMDTFTNNTTRTTETITISRAEYEAEIAKCKSEIADLKAYISEMESELNWFKEQFRLAQNRRFGASSEGSSEEVIDQMSFLFNEAESTANAEEREPRERETVVRAHTRKKRSGSVRDVVPKNIEVEEEKHELPEEERVCPECGETMQPIGTEVRETLKLIPAKAVLRRDIYVTYGCANCRDTGIEVPIVEAPKEPALIPGSFASPEAVANIIVQKFQMCVPLYRQELYWNSQKIMLSRQVMSDWVLKAAELLVPLYDCLHRFLGFAAVLHADETTLQVLREAGRSARSKSYMWLYLTGAAEEKQIVLYEYQEGRGGSFPSAFLKDFHGYLQTDGYSGYNDVENVVRVGCWAHLRRTFDEAVKSQPKGARTGSAVEGLAYCTKLFMIERDLQDLTPEERYEERLKREKPLLDQFKAWADTRQVSSKSRLGKAFTYLRNQWGNLTSYLLDGRLEISNNRAERSIKPFVMGRKNFLFANTPRGAQASAVLYSILETAKANGLDPYRYLLFLFKALPAMDKSDDAWVDPLLPWNAPDQCKRNPAAQKD